MLVYVQNRFAVFLVEFPDVFVHLLEMFRVSLPQFFSSDGVVIAFFRPFGGRLVDVPPQPNRLNEDADVLVMLQGQGGEILDARIGQKDR